MRKKAKMKLAKRYASSVEAFYPDVSGVFVCPTCLRHVQIRKLEEISGAHILPEAAGGRRQTLLCRVCNSTFGAKQDRWLGDHLRAMQDEGRILAVPQKGYVDIGGTRFGGEVRLQADGSIGVYVHTNRNSPARLSALGQVLDGRPRGLNISVPIPLLGRQAEVTAGFLTAAYLLLFDAIGYSWALQEHLDVVREQIRKPSESVIKGRYIAVCHERYFTEPWVGAGTVLGKLAVVVGMANRLIFFPPRDEPDLYNSLQDFDGAELQEQVTLSFSPECRVGPPFGVALRDRLLVMPDAIVTRTAHQRLLFFPDRGQGILLERMLTEGELNAPPPGVERRVINIRRSIEYSNRETGRQNDLGSDKDG